MGNYVQLAQIYDTVGISQFTSQIIPHVLDYMQRHDWLGRHIMEFGCGTGTAGAWLAENGYTVVGVDSSPEMIAVAQQKANTDMGLSVSWHTQDIQTTHGELGSTEMLIAFDVLNEMESIKAVQAVLASAHDALRPEKPLIFDLYTIEGLIKQTDISHQKLYEDANVMLLCDTHYDYERGAATYQYTAFQKQANSHWTRQDLTQVRRGYPLQAIMTLLKRTGYGHITILNEQLKPISSPNNQHRVIIVAHKA